MNDSETPSKPDLRNAAARFRTVCELHHFGVSMMRQNLKRRNPDASPAEIEAHLLDWLGHNGRDISDVPDLVERRSSRFAESG